MATFADIKSKASKVAADAGVRRDAYIVPLETVAASLGYESLAFDGDDNVSGAIDYDAKKIYVNSNHSPQRQRFTLAHEIGHAVMHSQAGGSKVDLRSDLNKPGDRKEIEANFFASNLLMPDDLYLEAWRTRAGSYKRLAALFGVSEQSATYKAKSLGLA